MPKVIKNSVDFTSAPVIFPLMTALVSDEGFAVKVKGDKASDLKLREYIALHSWGQDIPEVAFYTDNTWKEGYFAFNKGVWMVADVDVLSRDNDNPQRIVIHSGKMNYSYYAVDFNSYNGFPIDIVRYFASFIEGASSANIEVHESTDTCDYVDGNPKPLHSISTQRT